MTRVKFQVRGKNELQIGFLKRSKLNLSGYKVMTPDKKSGYDISLLSILEKI